MHRDKSYNSPETTPFAEIEIGGGVPGLQSEAIPAPRSVSVVIDPIRALFNDMRQIAQDDPSRYIDHNRVLYHRDQRMTLARVFYKQALFMRDFEDDFDKPAPFSAYYPYYQIMNHAQLRTYFTWRASVRRGVVCETSLSYAFLYVYELLNHIGADDAADGLARLLAFWQAYSAYDKSLDKYVLRWFKDYHVYYALPQPFAEFIKAHDLRAFYPDADAYEADWGDSFGLLAAASRYDIRHSPFYESDNQSLVRDCFNFVIDRLKEIFAARGVDFYDLYFQTQKKPVTWYPFDGSLFVPQSEGSDRRVFLSAGEVFQCKRGIWTQRAVADGNKRLTGYIMRRMETALRTAARFSKKMTGSAAVLDDETIRVCNALAVPLDNIIDDAVRVFYAERTKIAVSVDAAVLARVRREAQDIQEKLIVAEAALPAGILIPAGVAEDRVITADSTVNLPVEEIPAPAPAPAPDDEWTSFFRSLTDTEAEALRVVLNGGDIQSIADVHSIMAEVLVDNINQKALDAVGDNVLEYAETVSVYTEYAEQLSSLLRKR